MDQSLDFHTAKALLEWQVELGADEAIGDVPIDRYELEDTAPKPAPNADPGSVAVGAPPHVASPRARPEPGPADAVADAERMAAAAADLGALRDAMAEFSHCDLKKGARSLVFADGDPSARVMIIGEAPGRDEDVQGKPFVGRAGQLLDRMFAAIEMGRAREDDGALYITNILPWRPPQNRDPSPDEMAMMLPFVKRHVALADPDILILMGNVSCQGILGRKGITRMRGQWTDALGKPVLPMFHPAYLLRNPIMKREAWSDLLSLRARLEGEA